jgi:REP element-mobilizing transposase RayT
MGNTYKFYNPNGIYFVTSAVVQWADVFTRSTYSEIVVDSLKFCIEQKGLNLHAWVIMPNHIHLVISRNGKYSLSDIMRDFKKFTSRKIIEQINSPEESRKGWLLWLFRSAGEQNPNNENYQFWQQENHPIYLETPKFMKQKIDYVNSNPLKAKLVDTPERYVYSSAKDYVGEKGILPVIIPDAYYYATT